MIGHRHLSLQAERSFSPCEALLDAFKFVGVDAFVNFVEGKEQPASDVVF
jgi:hypothetical protein